MTKKSAVSYYDLLNAYKILFTQTTHVHLKNIQALETATLRQTYKQLALQTHPDRARLIGVNQTILETRFKQISNAYSLLDSFVAGTTTLLKQTAKTGTHYPPTPSPQKTSSRGKTRTRKDRFYGRRKKAEKKTERKNFHNSKNSDAPPLHNRPAGHSIRKTKVHYLPHTELLLGQFLFYTGHISLKNLIDAIQWQRKQRPSFGEIAVAWNILVPQDIADILKSKKQRELFGECAFRLNYINSFQYKAILAKQYNSQQPIGRFFIEKGLLDESDIEKLHCEMIYHNTILKRRAREKK